MPRGFEAAVNINCDWSVDIFDFYFDRAPTAMAVAALMKIDANIIITFTFRRQFHLHRSIFLNAKQTHTHTQLNWCDAARDRHTALSSEQFYVNALFFSSLFFHNFLFEFQLNGINLTEDVMFMQEAQMLTKRMNQVQKQRENVRKHAANRPLRTRCNNPFDLFYTWDQAKNVQKHFISMTKPTRSKQKRSRDKRIAKEICERTSDCSRRIEDWWRCSYGNHG